MWRFAMRRRKPKLSPYEIPILPNGRAYYAVIDVEALIIGNMDIVEQVAIVFVDMWGREALGVKYQIYQPMNASQIAYSYGIDQQLVQKGIDGYTLVTHDNYIHDNPYSCERWGAVRKRIINMCELHAIEVYAKGIDLEYRVFYGELPFLDLAWWGCPKYPGEVHDPLCECRFFSQYIPDLIKRPVYIC
jgi:hypothetical protein